MGNDTNTDSRLNGVLVINGFVPIIWNGEERVITVEEYLGVLDGWQDLRTLLD